MKNDVRKMSDGLAIACCDCKLTHNFNNIPSDILTALMHIYKEYLVTIERFEPSDNHYHIYQLICKELEETWYSIRNNEKSMSNQEVMEALIKDVGALVITWWLWNESR